MIPSLNSRVFGSMPSGESIAAWTLCGAGGLVLEVITYGAIVTRLLAPDREGHLEDVVLGFSRLEPYLTSRSYFGAMIGRVAGRITRARFHLEGNTFELARNDGANHLHGGEAGFDRKVWTATPVPHLDGTPSLRLTHRSREGDEGYPGTVDVAVTYTVSPDNSFLIETEATTDRATPISLTHHSYFNLAGENSGTIADHELQIHCDEFVFMDEQLTLLGRVGSVNDRDNDFRQPRNLGAAIPLLFRNHGDLYIVRKVTQDGIPTPASTACLFHRGTGRVLNVSTTEPYLQLYTGAELDGTIIGKSGSTYPRFAGVCFECESYADGANTPELGDIILRPGHPRYAVTTYAFPLPRS
jgi:aldose 1-epimerase